MHFSSTKPGETLNTARIAMSHASSMAVPANRRTSRPGFTLTELLVVIAIIVVLAAMSIPALNRIKGRADAAACSSNIRQCAALSLLFASERNGRLPRLNLGKGVIERETGVAFLPPEERTVTNPNVHFWPDLIATYADAGPIFACPSLKVNAESGPGGGKSFHSPLGIGVNFPPLCGGARKDGGPFPYIRLINIKDPARVVWFASSGGDVDGPWEERKDEPGQGSCFFRGYSKEGKGVMPRFAGKVAIGFVDGHVALVNPTEINWGGSDTEEGKFIGFTRLPR